MSKAEIFLRINGNTNAWPVFLGQDSPYYSISETDNYVNASYSILGCSSETLSVDNTKWEILFDAGNGLIQYLLQNFNRQPDVLVLTHPHSDHIISAEYIIQSYYRSNNKQKKMPVYATAECWQMVCQSFPTIINICDFRELHYGQQYSVPEAGNVTLAAYPVYHGTSARGAAMILAEEAGTKILFSGDVLFPLLTNEALERISDADILIPDCNNRFPYPKSNHWSLSGENDQFLKQFTLKDYASALVAPHTAMDTSDANHKYLSQFIAECINGTVNLFSDVTSFCKKTRPKQVGLSHYSGNEDVLHHQQEKLSQKDLLAWTQNLFIKECAESKLSILNSGDIIRM